jgi:hypothetical protein
MDEDSARAGSRRCRSDLLYPVTRRPAPRLQRPKCNPTARRMRQLTLFSFCSKPKDQKDAATSAPGLPVAPSPNSSVRIADADDDGGDASIVVAAGASAWVLRHAPATTLDAALSLESMRAPTRVKPRGKPAAHPARACTHPHTHARTRTHARMRSRTRPRNARAHPHAHRHSSGCNRSDQCCSVWPLRE